MSNINEFLGKFEGISSNPIKGLLELVGVSKNPAVQFAIALISIYAATAIIKTIKVDAEFPLKSILIMLFLMMIIFVFSALTKTKDKIVKLAAYILMFSVVLSTAFLTVAAASAIVFGRPEALAVRLSNALSIESLVIIPNNNDCNLPFDQRPLDCSFK